MIRSGKSQAVRKSTKIQRRSRNYRSRILASFRALGHGVDARTARMKTHAFYRAGGAAWTRCLD